MIWPNSGQPKLLSFQVFSLQNSERLCPVRRKTIFGNCFLNFLSFFSIISFIWASFFIVLDKTSDAVRVYRTIKNKAFSHVYFWYWKGQYMNPHSAKSRDPFQDPSETLIKTSLQDLHAVFLPWFKIFPLQLYCSWGYIAGCLGRGRIWRWCCSPRTGRARGTGSDPCCSAPRRWSCNQVRSYVYTVQV